jgi:hypothetical protein
MTGGAAVWLVLGGFFAALFFGIAAVVSVTGLRDLRRLLRGAERRQTGDDRE